jgi:hypothetical protein
VLAHIDGSLHGAQAPYSLVGGLTMPSTGREFAVICASNGTLIVDTHDLVATPVGSPQPAYWSVFLGEDADENSPDTCLAQTEHRGVAVYGSLIIESNLHRPYLRAFELTGSAPPFSVVRKANIDLNPPSYAAFQGAPPRLAVDQELGYLFVPGCPPISSAFVTLRLFDLQNYPVEGQPAPTALWTWEGGAPPLYSQNSFDVHIYRDGLTKRAVVSEFVGPGITFLDISNLTRPFVPSWQPAAWASFPVSTLGLVPRGTHSVWVDPTRSLLYNSYGDSSTNVYALQTPLYSFQYGANLPVQVPPSEAEQTYRTPPTSLTYGVPSLGVPAIRHHHVVEGLGMTGYAAAWDDGLVILDLRPDALSPEMDLAHVDTCPSTSCGVPQSLPCISSFHHGVWSVFKNQDSGVVYLSDQAQGLFLVRPEVCHLLRYGYGVASAAHPTIPSVSLEQGPPRVPRPPTVATGPFTAIPALDDNLKVTVRNLVPSAGRIGFIDVAVVGDIGSTYTFGTPGFPRYGTVPVPLPGFPVPFSFTSDTAVIDVPLAGVWTELPLYMQVAIYDTTGAPVVVATSRGTCVGVGPQRQ